MSKSFQDSMIFSNSWQVVSPVILWFTKVQTVFSPVMGAWTPLLRSNNIHINRTLLSLFFENNSTAILAFENNLNSILIWFQSSSSKTCDDFIFSTFFLIEELTIIFQASNNILKQHLSDFVWFWSVSINNGEY